MILTDENGGLEIRHAHFFADYMPALAAGLRRVVGKPDNPYAVFLVDFVDRCLAARNDLFPPPLTRAAAEMRMVRMLAGPVEVDGVVFSLRTLPNRRMRQKSKQLVAKIGVLEDVLEDVPFPAAPPSAFKKPATALSCVPTPPAVDLTAILEHLKALDARLDGMELMYGSAPAPTASAPIPDDGVVRRSLMHRSMEHRSLVEALRAEGVRLTTYKPAPLEGE